VKKTFAELLSEDRRWAILHWLEKSPVYEANHFVLHTALPSSGHRASLDVVRSELSWLAEQGLLAVEVLDGVSIARLTARGLDVAQGRAEIPGVKKPLPGF
jgi:Fe2+ or Zn2+ uptake regulation protein